MVYLIRSEPTLTGEGMRLHAGGGAVLLPYEEIVWIYIRKRTGKGSYRYYGLTETDASVTGELVVIDKRKDTYHLLEQGSRQKAGELFERIVEAGSSCFAGYAPDIRKLCETEFEQMVTACAAWWSIFGGG